MAREIIVSGDDYTGANPLYFAAYLVSDLRYVKGSTLETYDASHWSQYAVAMTHDATTGEYFGDMPAVMAGTYYVTVFVRAGASPAVDDEVFAEGEYEYPGTTTVVGAADTFAAQLAVDGATAFVSEFAEQVTYTPDGGTPLTRLAVVDRNPPAVVREDGKVLTDTLVVCLPNDATSGVTGVTPGRDTITVSGRYGGAARAHLVTAVIDSDAGVWTLRVK